MAKLEELMKALLDEVNASKAQLTANTTQLNALNSAHGDTKDLLDQTQKRLADVRAELIATQSQTRALVENAQKIASEIRGAADAYAADVTAKADAKAKEIVGTANKTADGISRESTRARQQLEDEVLQLRAEHSDLSTEIGKLRDRAKQFVGG